MTQKIVTEQDAQNLLANLGGIMGYTVRKSIINNWLSCLQPAPVNDGEVSAYGYERATEVSEGLPMGDRYGGFERKLSFVKPKDHPQFRGVYPLYRVAPDAAAKIAEIEEENQSLHADWMHVTAQRDELLSALKGLISAMDSGSSDAVYEAEDSAKALIAEIEGAKG